MILVNVRPSGDAGRCTKKSSKRVYSREECLLVTSIQKIKMVETSNVKVLLVVMQEKQLFLGKRLLIFLYLPPKSNEDIQGYRLIDMSILDSIMCKLLWPNCQDFGLNIYEDGSKRRAWLHYLCQMYYM